MRCSGGERGRVSGVFLIVFGFVVYSDSLALLTSFLEQHGIGSYLELTAGD